MRPTKPAQGEPKYPPLASILRPRTLSDVIGQTHLVGEGAPFRKMVENDRPMSTILWGMPGTGKTSMVSALANELNAHFRPLNATSATVKDIRSVIEEASASDQRTVVFVDECHRFSKSQQDVLLPVIEDGTITFFGATTENPKFSVNSTIQSRCLVYETSPLRNEDLVELLVRVKKYYRDKGTNVKIDMEAAKTLIKRCSGDARKFITALEAAIEIFSRDGEIGIDEMNKAIPSKHVVFDSRGQEHFDYAHCYQDAIQDSDVNGAMYWLAKWLNSGEDPAYICRRMLITSFEDCAGNPHAASTAMAACYATERTGMPECMIAMATATVEMALSKRNKIPFYAIHSAMADVQNGRDIFVPPHMRAGNNNYERIIKKTYVEGFKHDWQE
jgi:putative ATPase